MSWFPDLSTTTLIDAGEHVRAVGWLSVEHPFPRGSLPAPLLERMQVFAHQSGVSTVALGWSICLGWHDCELCGGCSETGIFGIPDEMVLYVVPAMITHYIQAHQYRPPNVFLRALARSPLPHTLAYRALVAPFRLLHQQYFEHCYQQRIMEAGKWALEQGGDEHAIREAAFSFFCDSSREMYARIHQAMVRPIGAS